MDLANMQQESYLYASARVRALENGIFSPAQADLILDARNNEELLKVLAGLGYDTQGADPEEPTFYEEVISKERERVLQMIASMAPEKGLFDFFLYLYDYHNIKVVLKGEILGEGGRELLMDAGTIRVKVIEKAVRERNKELLTENMTLGIAAALEAYSKSNNPQMIDVVLDRYCFADMLRCAGRSGSDFVMDYIRLQIDLVNLKAFLRLKKIGATEEFASMVFVPEGTVGVSKLLEAYALPLSGGVELFSAGNLGELMKKGAELFQKPGGIAELEKLTDNYLMDYVRKAKYVPFGIEPLVGYLFAKENEFRSLKILIAGKLGGLEHSRIRERLRESYV